MPLPLIGNLCLALAVLVCLFPLRVLVRNLRRKRDDGGGAIVGGIILIVLWTLLLAGLLLTVAAGGLDWLPLRRALLYPTMVAAAASLLAVTFISLTQLQKRSWAERLLWGGTLYLGPGLTIALLALSLNPTLGARVPAALYRWPWAALAGLSVLGCAGYCGYQGLRWAGRKFSGMSRLLGVNADLERKHLPVVAALDPERDFEQLLGFANAFQPAPVRELASTRLRTHPRFLDTMSAVLLDGPAQRGLEFLECARLTPEETSRFAEPAREAMLRFTDGLERDLRHAPAARRKAARRWSRHTFRTIAAKFETSAVDYAPAIEELEAVLAPGRGARE